MYVLYTNEMRMINFGIFFRISRNFDHSAITNWQLTQHWQKYQTTILAMVTLSMYVIELSLPISTKVVVLLHGSEEYDRYLGPTIFFAKWVKWWCRDMCCICCQERSTNGKSWANVPSAISPRSRAKFVSPRQNHWRLRVNPPNRTKARISTEHCQLTIEICRLLLYAIFPQNSVLVSESQKFNPI